MLKAEGLSVHHATGWRIRDINLELRSGEVLGVIGPNGAGKSTLFGALCGDIHPTSGNTFLGAKPLTAWPPAIRALHLAVLPQASTLSFAFTVRQVIRFGRLPHATGIKADTQIVDTVLDLCDLTELSQRSYTTLSGGERQRTHLARILAQLWPATSNKVLLLDEPTSALDPHHQHSVLKVVRQMADQGLAVAVVLHDMNLAARYCDRLLMLKHGQVEGLGSPADVLRPERLKAVFDLDVLIQEHPVHRHPLVIYL
ncbi:heme ABC transporter ATP-binding protein [Pseudomonas asuensis]|uniref:Hemin import ATP-binding protein HmuV n=1 Tax=Pseudomonas asuensis TaxID=1825787 RepID=A0ABQ2GZ05_9PSED|nr:heme ABC transporter ATP-binding protein [Pseudomonas asuensis]GGM19233.1 hemin import ATP-binding protein HmuV [Pseudomonas asuensis]